MEWFDALQAWAPIIQACAVVIAAGTVFWTYRELKFQKEQATTRFEYKVANEYRELARGLPVEALLGGELNDEEFEEQFPDLYSYVDLSNEQVILRFEERISKETWREWQNGIEMNLSRPAFKRAWNEIKDRSGTFKDLRRLEQEDFDTDPAEWTNLDLSDS